MCFNTSQSKKAQDLARRYGRKTDVVEIYQEIIEEKRRNGEKWDIALEEYKATAFPVRIRTGQKDYLYYKKYPIITSDENIQVMDWGLIPFWSRTEEQAQQMRVKTYNARSDKIFKTKSYAAPILRRRCLIPSTGYFENHHPSNKAKPQPYFIFLKSLEIFSMAGVYDIWVDPVTGEKYKTFSMITTDGNPKTNLVHNGGENPYRMPLILLPEQEELWLDKTINKDEIQEFLKPFPADDMNAYPINKERYLKSDIHSNEIIEPDRNIPNVLYEEQLF